MDEVKNYRSILVVRDAENLQSAIIEILKMMPDSPIVFVCSIKPYETTVEYFKEAGIYTGRMSFVDCVTKSVGGAAAEVPTVAFLDRPGDLGGIEKAVKRFLKGEEGKKYVVLDSLRVLAIYSNDRAVEGFVKSTINAGMMNNATVIAFMPEEGGETLTFNISKFFDKVMEVE